MSQPPSGGCVLKLRQRVRGAALDNQPPSGGCVLKQPLFIPCRLTRPSRLQAAVC